MNNSHQILTKFPNEPRNGFLEIAALAVFNAFFVVLPLLIVDLVKIGISTLKPNNFRFNTPRGRFHW